MLSLLLNWLSLSVKQMSRVSWGTTTGQQLTDLLTHYINDDFRAFPNDAIYYVATAQRHPVAFVKSRAVSVHGKPIADVCCINEKVIDKLKVDSRIWYDFNKTYGNLPLFHKKTQFYDVSYSTDYSDNRNMSGPGAAPGE